MHKTELILLQALDLSGAQLKKRQVEMIDIATDPVEKYVEEEDPCKFKSQKTGRGPLKAGWHVSRYALTSCRPLAGCTAPSRSRSL